MHRHAGVAAQQERGMRRNRISAIVPQVAKEKRLDAGNPSLAAARGLLRLLKECDLASPENILEDDIGVSEIGDCRADDASGCVGFEANEDATGRPARAKRNYARLDACSDLPVVAGSARAVRPHRLSIVNRQDWEGARERDRDRATCGGRVGDLPIPDRLDEVGQWGTWAEDSAEAVHRDSPANESVRNASITSQFATEYRPCGSAPSSAVGHEAKNSK